jgi:small-conductance mechanosensitive channel
MNKLREGQRSVWAVRRSRVSHRPVSVAAPTLAVSALVVVSTLLAGGLGLYAPDVVAVGVAAAVCGAVATRRALASLLAGVGLALVRPFSPGESVRVYVPDLDDVVDAEIVRIGIVNTTMATRAGVLVMPNARMLRGAPEHPDDLDLSA